MAKSIYLLITSLVFCGLALAQGSPQEPEPSAGTAELAAEVKTLRELLLQTQKQLAAQQQEIDKLKLESKNGAPASAMDGRIPTQLEPVAGDPAPALKASTGAAAPNAGSQPLTGQYQTTKTSQKSQFSSFNVGGAVLSIGGFVDLENIYRTTNTQSNIATDFGLIPYSNTAQGNISEYRMTAQFSRLTLKVEDHFAGNDVAGYVETDFSGNDAPGVYQTANGHTNRLRLFFADVRRGKWWFLGGQTWSWLTPNRSGIGPMPVDLATTYNEDQNLGVGIPYTRAAEFRVAYHVNDRWAIGAGIEDPNQYIGGYVALPAGFTSIGTQFDNGEEIGAANSFPDILTKSTYDNKFASRHFHAEVVGLVTGAHASVMPTGTTSFKTHSTVGGGGQIAGNYDLLPDKLVILANAFWSDGGAHYLAATGPQLVVRPNPAGTDVSLSMVHAGAGSAGLEWRASPKHAFAIYYGADYFGRNFFPDTTDTAHPGTIIGYGGPGSPNTNNRAIQQATFNWIETLWTQPRYGAMQAYVQYSYLTRAPWYVAPGDPRSAHLNMFYFGFRYILPSTAGTLMEVPRPE